MQYVVYRAEIFLIFLIERRKEISKIPESI